MRPWVFFLAAAGFALVTGVIGFTAYEEGKRDANRQWMQAIDEIRSPKAQAVGKKHDICFRSERGIDCTVAYLDGTAVIADGQVLSRQPDGSWFYQDGVIQISVCVSACEVKGEGLP